jgi:hypothetical protein
MPTCDTCGNNYDKTFEVRYEGSRYNFDSFECAIHKLAPRCQHCGCQVIGHGVEDSGVYFCCVHCASQAGVAGLKDRS